MPARPRVGRFSVRAARFATQRMSMRRQKTYTPRPADIDRAWWVVDADGMPLGRLASEVAVVLRGKHKPTFAPHISTWATSWWWSMPPASR